MGFAQLPRTVGRNVRMRVCSAEGAVFTVPPDHPGVRFVRFHHTHMGHQSGTRRTGDNYTSFRIQLWPRLESIEAKSAGRLRLGFVGACVHADNVDVILGFTLS